MMQKVTLGTATLYQGDCMDLMATIADREFDLAIVDPPYGLDYASNVQSDYSHLASKSWDSSVPNDDYFVELFRISANQIVWGGNYFRLPTSKGFIFWDKSPTAPSFADGEMAWISFDTPAKKFVGRTGNEVSCKDRIHPTQKPVKLYEWLLTNYAKQGDRILDTHLGSGSSAIAAHYGGFDFVGCELDKDYFNAACKRIEKAISQQDMFAPVPSNQVYEKVDLFYQKKDMA